MRTSNAIFLLLLVGLSSRLRADELPNQGMLLWFDAAHVTFPLMLSSSFGRMTAEQLHDLSRIYPFHSARKSARPVDAFTSKYPTVYDFKVDPHWHELTFYNTDATADAAIGVDLAGDTAEGGLGLDATRSYYLFDFWNDRLIGRVPGKSRFEQTLRPGEARMMSVHEAADHPQFLSSDRHIMQGFGNLLGCEWDARANQLRGVCQVIGGEPYKLIIAANGMKPLKASADQDIAPSVATSRLSPATRPAVARVEGLPGQPELIALVLTRPENGPIAWTIEFQ